MHARVTTLVGPPERIVETFVASWDMTNPIVRQLAGYRGASYMVDRYRGKAVVITLWNTANDMYRSEEQLDRLQGEMVGAWEVDAVSVERFEVAGEERVGEDG